MRTEKMDVYIVHLQELQELMYEKHSWCLVPVLRLFISEEIAGYALRWHTRPSFTKFGFKNDVLEEFPNLRSNKNSFFYFCNTDMRKNVLEVPSPSLFIALIHIKL
jgi:hypothetical protein